MLRLRSISIALWALPMVAGLSGVADASNFSKSTLETPVIDAIRGTLSRVRMREADVRLPKGFAPPATLSPIDGLFERPLDIFTLSDGWLERLGHPQLTFPLIYGSALDILGESALVPVRGTPSLVLSDFPSHIHPHVQALFQSIYPKLNRAQRELDRAVGSLSSEEREAFLNLFKEREFFSHARTETYGAMEKFDMQAMLTAGLLAAEAADTIRASLPKISGSTPLSWSTPLGRFVIRGKGDDTSTSRDLTDVIVLIDLGGNNTYRGPVAGAKSGQIRLVVDHGNTISIASEDESPHAGSGLFGIGILMLTNPNGIKTIESPSFSQGCGVGGVGALVIQGESHLTGGKFVQGTGAYGIGVLHGENGDRSKFSAVGHGQGLGLVKGIGLFLHRGSDATLRGGMVEPDPREPLGAVSLCQGVGYGHRAYSGGGIGICSLQGDRLSVTGSYFAQGAGYWHALGIFHLRGNESVLQARRYDLGAGVHYAFGHFRLEGDGNRVLNWGVGPAYGWDRGLGTAIIKGSGNEVQADWGTGTASIGSLSFSVVMGNRNKLILPSYGSGSFYRDEFGVAVHAIHGSENVIKSPVSSTSDLRDVHRMSNPWGVVGLHGATLSSKLNPRPVEWTTLPPADPRTIRLVNLPNLLAAADSKPPLSRIRELVDVAAAFSADKTTPRQALSHLFQLPESDVPHLVQVLDPAAVEALIQLRLALASHGGTATQAIVNALPGAVHHKEAVLMNFLDTGPAEMVIPVLKPILFDETDRRQPRAALILGRILNRNTGQAPGGRGLMESLQKNPSTTAKPLISRMYMADALGILSKTTAFTPENRVQFLKAGPSDITETLGEKGADEFLRQYSHNWAETKDRAKKELAHLAENEQEIRHGLHRMLASTTTLTAYAAVVALGQIGHKDDVKMLTPFLLREEFLLRESAAVALQRLGAGGIGVLNETLRYGAVDSRRTAAASLSQAVTAKSISLFRLALDDPDPQVRLTVASVLRDLPPALKKHQSRLFRMAEKKLAKDPDPSVLLAWKELERR